MSDDILALRRSIIAKAERRVGKPRPGQRRSVTLNMDCPRCGSMLHARAEFGVGRTRRWNTSARCTEEGCVFYVE